MRPWLRWLLGLSVLSSIVAWLWPNGVTQAVSRTEALLEGAAAARTEVATMPPVARPPLPHRLPGIALAKADFDPFVGAQPPAPPPPDPPAPVQAPAPPPPSAPPLDYRYLGRMVDPAGKHYVYLGRTGDAAASAIAVSVGTRLDEGYVVEAISTDSIRLVYPPLDTHIAIDIPAAQETSR
jgi:hypothetical protein